MNSVSRRFVGAVLAGTVTLGVASAQGGNFLIPGSGAPEISIASDWDGARFLVGMQGNAGQFSAVVARFVEPTGKLGPLVTLADNGGSPRVAFGGGQYLVVWSDLNTWPVTDIYGMFVQPDGTHGSAFPICVDAQAKDVTGIAYAGGRFIVPYSRGNSLLARRVNLAGFVGPELTLTNSYFAGLSADNAGTDGSSYLIAWVDDINRHEVHARVVLTAGLPGPEFVVNASAEASNDILTVSGTALGYLVVFSDEVGGAGSGEWDLFSQAVSAVGFPVGMAHPVSSAPGSQWAPFLASDGANFMLSWTDQRWDANKNGQCDADERTCWDIYGRYLAFDGTPLGSEWPIVERIGDQFASPMAFGAGKYLMAWTDGPIQANGGNVYGTFLPQLPFASLYCTPKTNSLGCVPMIGFSGVPSASSAEGFTLSATNVLNNKSGLLFYSLVGPDNLPFMGGTLCGRSPVRRTPVLFSGGNPPPNDCSGVYSFDFNSWAFRGPDPMLVAGQAVWGQFWSRDPLSSFSVGLTAGVEFVIGL